ncbi:MAG: hypothetical protein RLZZ08_999 [Pseudomonadota bacterium]|jgi:O-antigen ligase
MRKRWVPGAREALFFFGSWLGFRLVSDWPRGVMRSGSGVAPWMENLSYIGLVGWIAPAILALLIIRKPHQAFAGDPVLRAHLLLSVFQLWPLANSTLQFGMEGLLAGVYIWTVSLSFLVMYSLGVFIGQNAFAADDATLTKTSAYIVAFLGFPSIALALVQIASGTGIVIDGVNRVFGGTSSPNVLGAVMLVQLMIAFAAGTKTLRNSLIWYLALGGIALVGAFSLSGFVCVAFAGTIFWVVQSFNNGKLNISPLWMTLLIVAVSAVFYFVGAEVAGRFGELGNDSNSLTWRTATWADSISYLDSWTMFFFGGGLGFDHLALPEEPHNEWLRVLLEMGVIGLLIFILPILRLLLAMRELLKTPDQSIRLRAVGIISATAGLCLWAAVDSVLRTAPSALCLWSAAGLLVGNARALRIERLRGAAVENGRNKATPPVADAHDHSGLPEHPEFK